MNEAKVLWFFLIGKQINVKSIFLFNLFNYVICKCFYTNNYQIL
jgi:hypothetical protein